MPGSVTETTNRLMANIVAGRYSERLPAQDALAKEFGVSRTVLREAISRLEYSNVIRVRPKTGTVVLPPEEWRIINPQLLLWHARLTQRDYTPEEAQELHARLTRAVKPLLI